MRRMLLLAALIAAGGLAQAGTVEVTFKDSDKFSDIGRNAWDREQTLATLKTHFEGLGKLLAASQKLAIEVSDVDLAGELQWGLHRPDLRVLRGRADWPRIDLHYTLSDAGRTVREADAKLVDMNYMMTAPLALQSKSLAYERRMIDRWFNEAFAAP